MVAFTALAVMLFLTAAVMFNRSPGWHNTLGFLSYYVDENGDIARGYRLIDDQPYYFNSIGRPYPEGWIMDADSGAEKYYSTGDGKLAMGWKYKDGKAWYFYQDKDKTASRLPGERAISYTTSGGIRIGEDGYIDGEEGEAIGYGIDVLNRYGWNLESAFKYASSLKYADGRELTYGLKIHSCALEGFRRGEGNCLAWSGVFCVMAKMLGYDCKHVWGTLRFRGEDVTHAWTEIWEDDGPHIYDPRKGGDNSMAGYDKHYGDKGTYKYNLDSRTYLAW